jgi:DNA-binding MarR family transcriptional regulator
MAKSFDLATSPSHLLRRANQLATDFFDDEDGVDGLTPRQLAVLHAVDLNDGVSQTELVKVTGIDRSTLADMIMRMQKRELLARRRTEEDGRANAVRMTTTGRRALRASMAAMIKADAALLDALPARSRTEFLKILTLLAATHSERLEKNQDGEKKRRAKR